MTSLRGIVDRDPVAVRSDLTGGAGTLTGIDLGVADCTMPLDTSGSTFFDKIDGARQTVQAPRSEKRGEITMVVPNKECLDAADPTGEKAYRLTRNLLAFAKVFMDDGVRLVHKDSGLLFELDEQFGGSSHVWPNRAWMGAAVDSVRTMPFGGVQYLYAREFDNALVVYASIGMGIGPVTITYPSAGVGKKWQHLSGTQRSDWNDGLDAGATELFDCYNARFLKRVNV